MLKTIRNIISALKVETKKPIFDADKRIVEAFKIKGVQYYCFDDAFNLPIERAFAATDYYSELRQGVSREYLEAYINAQQNILASSKIDITKLAVLNNQLKERIERIFPHELVYKLASVIYFDKTENPYRFEYKYGLEKIKIFRSENIEDFFLKSPVKKYLPFNNISTEDLDTYMKVGTAMNEHHLKTLLSITSKNQSNEGLSKELHLLSITT